MTRTRSYTIAAVLQFVLSAFTIVTAIPLVLRGMSSVDQSPDTPPFVVVLLAFVLAVLGLVSAYGVWRGQRWAVILTILIRAVDGVAALPGVLFAPTVFLRVTSIATVAASIVVIGLLLWPASRPAAGGSTIDAT